MDVESAPPAPPSAWTRFTAAFEASPVTVSIVVLTVGVWLLHLGLQRWDGINTDLTLGDNGMGIHGQWWRLFTPMVVHFGVLHIGLNMLMLWQLGPPVEKILGRVPYFFTYVACGVAGSVLSDVMLGRSALSGGASGAIVGVVGVLVGNAFAVHQLHSMGRRSTQRLAVNPAFARSIGIQIVVWIAISAAAIPGIDNWAHIGGGVVGVVVGAALGFARSVPAPA